MVNVNKNIKPGVKVEPAAPKRRPRNQALNSSKKLSGQGKLVELRKQKLNCSTGRLPAEYVPYYKVVSEQEFADTVGTDVDTLREIVAEIEVEYGENVVGYIIAKDEYGDAFVEANIESGFITESGRVLNGSNEGYIYSSEMKDAAQVNAGLNSSVDTRFEKYFDKVTDQQLADFYGIDVEEIIDVNKDIENANYGKVVAHYIPKSEYAEVLVDGDWESLDILDDGTVGFSLGEGGGKATRFYGVDIDTIEERLAEAGLNSSRTAKKTRMNCSADTKITTESGNEISMSEVKVVQNPSTNELALFIPENDEDTIPEGFTVIGDVVSAGGEEAEDSEEDESEKSEELDSSKKTGMNCDYSEGDCFAVLWPAYIDDSYKCACCGKSFPAGHNSVQLGGHKPDGMHFIYEYTKDNRVGNSVNYDPYNLPPEDSEGGVFKVIVGEEADDEGYRWLDFCRNCWPKLTSKSPEEIYAEYSVPEKKKNKLTEEPVNSSLGGGNAVANGYSRHITSKKVDVDSSIKRDLEAVLATGDRNAIHHVVDDSGYGEKMMDAVGKFLAFTYGYSWEEDADAETWTVREDEGAGDLVGIIIDEDIANVNAEALVRTNLDWDKSVQDVCAWVVDQLGLPAPPSRLNIELDEAQLKKLYDIAEIYNTSNPISGSWEHEVEHEQAAISRGLGVSLEEAKEIMKQYLGFDDSNFE